MALEEQRLTAEDQLFILMQAALYLTATRGMAAPEVRTCYERAESLCHSLNRPLLLYSALMGQWRYSLMTDKLTATMQIAKRVYSQAREQDLPAMMIGGCQAILEMHESHRTGTYWNIPSSPQGIPRNSLVLIFKDLQSSSELVGSFY
jgi:hypothetical protein